MGYEDWNKVANYKVGDLVYEGSVLYEAVANNVNSLPSLNVPAIWVLAPTGVLGIIGGTGISALGAPITTVSNTGVLSVSGAAPITIGGTPQNPIVGISSPPTPVQIGSFFSSTTQTLVAGVPLVFTYDTTAVSIGGVSLTVPFTPWGIIALPSAGTYRVFFSVQATNGGGGNESFQVWVQLGGVPLADSNSEVVVKNNENDLISCEIVFTILAPTVLEVVGYCEGPGRQAIAFPVSVISPIVPVAIPSIITNVQRIG